MEHPDHSQTTGDSRVEFKVTIVEPSLTWTMTLVFGPGTMRRTIGFSILKCHSCISAHNDVEIRLDASVAHFQSLVTFESGYLVISDTIASTGTFVNGHRLQPGERIVLSAMDEVRMGQTVITFARLSSYFGQRTFMDLRSPHFEEPVLF